MSCLVSCESVKRNVYTLLHGGQAASLNICPDFSAEVEKNTCPGHLRQWGHVWLLKRI